MDWVFGSSMVNADLLGTHFSKAIQLQLQAPCIRYTSPFNPALYPVWLTPSSGAPFSPDHTCGVAATNLASPESRRCGATLSIIE